MMTYSCDLHVDGGDGDGCKVEVVGSGGPSMVS